MTDPREFRPQDRVVHPHGSGVVKSLHPRPGDDWPDDLEIQTDDGRTILISPTYTEHAPTTTPGDTAMTDSTSTDLTAQADAILDTLPLGTALPSRVYGVLGDTRTIVAAFPTPLDALVWQDHLTDVAASDDPGDGPVYDRYEVPGLDVAPWELEPFLRAAKSVTPKGGPS